MLHVVSDHWTSVSQRMAYGPPASESLKPEVMFKMFNHRKGEDLYRSELTVVMIREAHPMSGILDPLTYADLGKIGVTGVAGDTLPHRCGQ